MTVASPERRPRHKPELSSRICPHFSMGEQASDDDRKTFEGEDLVMSAKKSDPGVEKALTVVGNPEALQPTLKCIGGSQSDDWNNVLANQTLNTLWRARSNDEFQKRQNSATLCSARWHQPE